MGEKSGTRLFGPRGGAGNAKLEPMLGGVWIRIALSPGGYLSARGQQKVQRKTRRRETEPVGC
jgi:hypothetical protein